MGDVGCALQPDDVLADRAPGSGATATSAAFASRSGGAPASDTPGSGAATLASALGGLTSRSKSYQSPAQSASAVPSHITQYGAGDVGEVHMRLEGRALVVRHPYAFFVGRHVPAEPKSTSVLREAGDALYAILERACEVPAVIAALRSVER